MDNSIHINPESVSKFSAFKNNPIPEGYESPVDVYIRHVAEEIEEQREGAITAQICEQIGVNVDKDELVRALNYDRNQFNEGYRKGYFAAMERKNDTTALDRVIDIMQRERKCVLRQDTVECDCDCANCELVLPKEEVNAAYDYVLVILQAIKLGYEIGGEES